MNNKPVAWIDKETGCFVYSQYDYEDLAKFAWLIVAECVNALETEVDSWKEMYPYQGSIKRLGTKAIKQHFGVEE